MIPGTKLPRERFDRDRRFPDLIIPTPKNSPLIVGRPRYRWWNVAVALLAGALGYVLAYDFTPVTWR